MYLNDGSLLHRTCFYAIENEYSFKPIKDTKDRIATLKWNLEKLEKDYQYSRIKNIFNIFWGEKAKKNILAKKELCILYKNQLEEHSKALSLAAMRRKDILEQIYDYYPDYPPDWEDRKKIKLLEMKWKCEKCWRFLKEKHLHHIRPLWKGGSNKLTNLLLICERCHFKEHGVNAFRRNKHVSELTQKRIALIHKAMIEGKNIKFTYVDREKVESVRIVSPEVVKKWITMEGVDYAPEIIYMTGHCFIDNDERNFRVERIKWEIEICEKEIKADN